MKFSACDTVRMTNGKDAVIQKFIGAGGTGEVYLAEYLGEKQALKWYKHPRYNANASYAQVAKLVKTDAPDASFLWPKAVTGLTDGEFGCIIPLLLDGFVGFNRLFVKKSISLKTRTDIAINIVSAFGKLHERGLCYHDFNDGTIFVDTQTGNVIFGDFENIASSFSHTAVMFSPRYAAPEIVVGDGTVFPSALTDIYTMSAILFMLLFIAHPLEGKKWMVPMLTAEHIRELYGKNPVFVFDEQDDSNRPVEGIHDRLTALWEVMPPYIKNSFTAAFSREALHDPSGRTTEFEWLKLLTRFRADIISCSCGEELIYDGREKMQCGGCGKLHRVPYVLRFPEHRVPAVKGTRIYRTQLAPCSLNAALDPVGVVLAPTDLFGSCSSADPWLAVYPDRKDGGSLPITVRPLTNGTTIETHGFEIYIEKSGD